MTESQFSILSNRMRISRDHESGSILPLVSLFVALGLLVVLITTAAVSLYLERKQLFSLADGAALHAAEAFRVIDTRVENGQLLLQLDDAQVAEAAEYYLSGLGVTGDGVRLIAAYSPDQRSARVSLQRYWQPPLLTLFVAEGIEVQVEATARVVFDAPPLP